MMISTHTKMPRNVGVLQAAAILYGDWGTSKAYVIGLAFALTGHASFWLIALVGVLNILVGINYIAICKYYPSGGGVYASVRNSSKVLALVGAFFLLADYIVTAALSALSAFYYFGVSSPDTYAIGAIFLIGLINFFGPRYSANLALMIGLPTFVVMVILGLLTLPHLDTAVNNLQPLTGSPFTHWLEFVSIIVALSGIESIANITGVMKLDKGSTMQNPSVTTTARKSILWVTAEVVTLTTLFGLAINALPGLSWFNHTVNAPGEPDVRDYMLRYMGKVFATDIFNADIGMGVSVVISVVIGVLLLSAVNTAIVALETLLFVISNDKEIPILFKRLNPFGVPHFSLLAATILPMGLLSLHGDIAALADLYAVGFVGAIATNLGVTSLNKTLPLRWYERTFMFSTFLVMLSIELTLLFDKPHAANFAVTIMAIGLFLRGLVVESHEKKTMSRRELLAKHKLSENALIEPGEKPEQMLKGVLISSAQGGLAEGSEEEETHLHLGMLMCAVTHIGKTLEFAIEEAKNENQLLHVLFVKQQRIITQADREKEWWEDEEACKIVDHLVHHCLEMKVKFLYCISDSAVDTIVDTAHNTKVSQLILGLSRQNKFIQLLQGNFIARIGRSLSKDIDLIIVS